MDDLHATETGGSPGRLASWIRPWPAALAVFVVAMLVRLPFVPAPGFWPDQDEVFAWSHRAATGGLAEVYRAEPGVRPSNYPPVYIYGLRGLADVFHWCTGRDMDESVRREVRFQRDSTAARAAVAIYKMPAVLADGILGGLLVLLLWRRVGRTAAVAVSTAYVLMPVVVHVSSVWGQVDALPTLLVVASLELGRRRRPAWMAGAAALAVLTKAQAIVFAPIWVIVICVAAGGQARGILAPIAVALAVVVVVMVPFVDQADGVARVYTGAASFYPFLHLNGFSGWFVAAPLDRPRLGELGSAYPRDDVPVFLGFTPRLLGLAAFAAACLAVGGVLWRRRCDEPSLLWAARCLPLAFFVLSTQMHERYSYLALGVWAWAMVSGRRWWAGWLLLGACSSINVLWAWAGPGDGAVVTWIRDCLWSRWLGVSPGVWCALGFTAVFVFASGGWIDGFRPWTSVTPRATEPTGSPKAGDDANG